MKWTMQCPSEDGWYWWKVSELATAVWPVMIGQFGGKTVVYDLGLCSHGHFRLEHPRKMNGYWWSEPIKEPVSTGRE